MPFPVKYLKLGRLLKLVEMLALNVEVILHTSAKNAG